MNHSDHISIRGEFGFAPFRSDFARVDVCRPVVFTEIREPVYYSEPCLAHIGGGRGDGVDLVVLVIVAVAVVAFLFKQNPKN